jgi:5-methylcytosine-specific restriction endonuclease McrA
MDMVGRQINDLEVIKFHHSDRGAWWVCKCVCGKETIQRTVDLNRGKAKSCGCKRYQYTSEKLQKSLVGQRFGRLIAIERDDKQTKGGTYFYKCVCDCGEVKIINGNSLRRGLTKSCGCLKIEMNMKQYDNGVSTGYYHQKRLNASNQKEHKAFRKAVLERDNYTCTVCGKMAEAGLCAHHIKSWSLYPELRNVVSNGITLCRKCHAKAHTLYPKEIL